MRPIDADLLMEKLNGIWDCNDMTFAPVDGCCIDADCKSCRWRETIEYVKRLVQNQTTISPWHSVEEPPKDGEWVLIWGDGFHVPIQAFHESGCWLDDQYEKYTATHWMPLPEPPKEEENGN